MEENIKRAAVVLFILLLISTVMPCALGEQGHNLHLQMDLPGEWRQSKTGYDNSAQNVYTHISGAQLFQIGFTTDLVVGNDTYQQYYNTVFWPTVLKTTLDRILEGYGCAGSMYSFLTNNGVNCYSANTELLGASAVIAIMQYDNDFWVLICLEGKNLTASSVFEEVYGSISVAESMDDDTGLNSTQVQYNENDGYTISEIPAIVHLDDQEINIYTQNTPEDSLTMQRTDVDKATMDWYVGAQNAKMIITYPNITAQEFRIEIRVKDEQYSGAPSWDELNETELSIVMHMLYKDQISPYEVYKTDTATFTVFKMSSDKDGLRYATVKNGDMIYVHMERNNGALTDEDDALLKRVVDSMEFIDK